MLDSFATNATVAKIHAIHGGMFTKENYHEMVGKRSVAEIAEYLKKSPRFKEALRDVDPNTVHRGLLEELLQKSNFDTYVRLCKFQRLDVKPFYNFLVQKIEVEQIIAAANRINTKVSSNPITDVPMYVKKHSKLDLIKLRMAANFGELLDALKGTPYYKVLIKESVDDSGRLNYPRLEIDLLTFYYKRLLEYVDDNFSLSDAENLRKIILTEIDIINITNAYRLKAFFNYSSDQIKERQLPFTRIGKRRMNTYYEKESPDEMLEALTKTVYGRNGLGNAEYIETKVQVVLCDFMRHIVARSCSAPVVIYAFMKLCDVEVKNTIHIIEGIRYDIDPSEIENNMIVY